MAYYYNGVGRRLLMPERPLEPPDCWRQYDPEEEEDIVVYERCREDPD